MEICDLSEKYHDSYFCCLEDWSDEMKEAGDHKERWFCKMKEKGLRVKIAVEDGKACGMIQYVPIEASFAEGSDLYFINCIWVHGYKKGIGNFQKRGIGTALLEAAEEDVRSMGKKGIAAWGLALPFWMKASWFRNHGYLKAGKTGMSVLLWKPFSDDAQPPQWVKEKKKPVQKKGRVTVTSFINGWCPAQNIVHERAKRAALEIGEPVHFEEISTFDKNNFEEWGISDALFIDGKKLRNGPPPSYKKIRRKMERKVRQVK